MRLLPAFHPLGKAQYMYERQLVPAQTRRLDQGIPRKLPYIQDTGLSDANQQSLYHHAVKVLCSHAHLGWCVRRSKKYGGQYPRR